MGLFATVYISMRLFGLPVYVAQIGAWLTPLFAMPYVYPRIVHVEVLIEGPILFTLTCVFVLSVALFHRMGKPKAGSGAPAGIGGILVTAAGFTPLFCTYFSTWLFPLIAGTRWIKKIFRLEGSDDEFFPPAFLNRILAMVFGSERHLVGRVPLPIGSSIILLARR